METDRDREFPPIRDVQALESTAAAVTATNHLGSKSNPAFLSVRDDLFRRLHSDFLKPRGYVSRAGRSELRTPPILRAVLLRSSRWNTANRVRFDVNLKVAHDDYNPWTRIGARAGTGLKDVGLIDLGLAALAGVPGKMWTLDASANVTAVEGQVRDALERIGLPILNRMETLEGIVSLYAERGPAAGCVPRSWALVQLGRREEALKVVEAEMQQAPHEKARSFASALLERIRRREDFRVGE